jgi:hypothetical protein
MSTPAPPNEPKESDLLVPFEIQNLPKDYKEYYLIKRNNLFSSIQGFPALWKYYTMLDDIWLREISDLKPPGNVAQFFPLMLYINAHAKIRISIELASTLCILAGNPVRPTQIAIAPEFSWVLPSLQSKALEGLQLPYLRASEIHWCEEH